MNEHAFPNLSTTLRYTVPEDETGVPRFGSIVARFVSINLRRPFAYSFDSNSSIGTFENFGSATYQRESAKARRNDSIMRCSRSVEREPSALKSNPFKIFNAINAVIPCPLGAHSFTLNPR